MAQGAASAIKELKPRGRLPHNSITDIVKGASRGAQGSGHARTDIMKSDLAKGL